MGGEAAANSFYANITNIKLIAATLLQMKCVMEELHLLDCGPKVIPPLLSSPSFFPVVSS